MQEGLTLNTESDKKRRDDEDSITEPDGELNLYKDIPENEEDNDGENRHIKEEDKIGVLGASTTIVKAIIGMGITNMPMLFKVLGIIPATILMVLNLLLHINTVRFLMIAKKYTQRYSYSFYSKAAMGSFGTIMTKVAISLLSFCTCCVYLKSFGNIVYMLMSIFIKQGEGFFYTKSFYIILVFFVIMPLMFKKDLSALKNASKVGVAGIFMALISIILVFLYKVMNGIPLHFDKKYLYPSGTWLEILSIVPASLDAYIFQQNTFPIYTQLKPRNSSSMNKATTIGVFFSFIAYQITGVLGVLSYGDEINDFILFYFREDISRNPGDKFIGIVCFICIFSFFVSALLSFPLNFLAMRNNFSSLILFLKNKFSTKKEEVKTQEKKGDDIKTGFDLDHGIGYIVLTLTLAVGVLIISIAVEKIIILCKYSGVSCNNYITIMSPALFVLILSKKWDKNRVLSVFVFAFGVLMMLAFIASEILA